MSVAFFSLSVTNPQAGPFRLMASDDFAYTLHGLLILYFVYFFFKITSHDNYKLEKSGMNILKEICCTVHLRM